MNTTSVALPEAEGGFLEKAGAAIVLAALEKIKNGRLTVALPDGTTRVFGDHSSPVRANIAVRRPDFFRRVLLWGDVGFGECGNRISCEFCVQTCHIGQYIGLELAISWKL